jgi:quercetin dioxygenase-like cupin family protein
MMTLLSGRCSILLRASTATVAAAVLGIAVARAQPAPTSGARVTARQLMRHDLVGLPGKEVTLSTIEVPPGASSAPHKHEAQVFVYVLEGHMIMQVKGGPRMTLGPGQTFYENPSDIHAVSANASKAEPAKFLAFVIKDKDKPGLIPVPQDLAQAEPSTASSEQGPLTPARTTAPGLMTHDVIGLPDKQVVMAVVQQRPGASGKPHRHYAQVFVYVLQGKVIMQVKGGPRVTLGEGQTFYESPSDIHTVSANASTTEPAKFLAILIKDKGRPVTSPVPAE